MPEVSDSPIPLEPARRRVENIDVLRGLVMVVMALDHARDFLSHDALLFPPLDLTHTYAALFFTRWITHFCAPVFCFLAGTAAFLSLTRGKTKTDLAWFLVTRGLWLVLLELTVMQFAWTFNFDMHSHAGGVIWSLGWSMVALAVLIYLPVWAIAAFGIVMIGTHNLFDPVPPEAFGSLAWLWNVLHAGNSIHLSPTYTFFILYPLVPWIGVMAAGYAYGAVVKLDRERRRRRTLWLGISLCAAFVVFRATNIYGDPSPWSRQQSLLFSVFSFIKCEKYPPSLLFLLMTLGPSFIVLALLDRDLGKFWRPFIVFGRVPLFFYIVHIFLIHAIALFISYLRYGGPGGLFVGPLFRDDARPLYPPDYGFGLAGVYAVWLIVVIALYPVCRWFAEVKQRRRGGWLSYL
jgi:uncharacterized membrane protein